jgi:hypothetical protein
LYLAVIATLLNRDIGRLETIIVLVCQTLTSFLYSHKNSLCMQLLKEAATLSTIEASAYEANHSRMNKIPNEVKITKNGVFRDINTEG